MRTLTKSRKRVATVVVLLCLASGGGWALSAQAFASSATRQAATTTTLSPTPPRPPSGVHSSATPTVTATNAHCGQTITASLTLNGDLTCPGATALTVAGTSVTLNLNGHTINSDNSSYCIVVSGTTDTVENGTITHCYVGILANGSKGTYTKLTITSSSYGVDDLGASDKITANTVAGNAATGIIASGDGATLTGNRVSSNNWGMVVEGSGVNASGNALDSNTVNGLYINESSLATATITANSANYNGSEGMYTVPGSGPATDGGGNTAHGNGYTNATSTQCVGIACS
ncbi:MAG: hypothetical protein ACTHJM_15040 [Marmoricola sp.]